jgi:two-component system chemotaxis response regulator CheY
MANILAVDDSNSMRKLLANTLAEAGHKVTQAQDGVEGLAMAQKAKFDLVITDINMPNMDGITLLRKLRALPAFRVVPILMLTTEMDPERKKQAKDAGATGWLVKPFSPEQILATIRKVVD